MPLFMMWSLASQAYLQFETVGGNDIFNNPTKKPKKNWDYFTQIRNKTIKYH